MAGLEQKIRDYRRKSLGTRKAPVWTSLVGNKVQWQITDYNAYVSEGFNMNTLIYSAIMYKARSVLSAPLRAYRDDRVLPYGHPLSRLVRRPNENQSWEEFHALNIVYLNVSGNCYVWINRDDGEVVSLHSLRPDRVKLIPRQDEKTGQRRLKGFLYVPEGKKTQEGVPILPQDCMHVKLPNPADPMGGAGYGLSPISPLAHAADVDNSVSKYLKNFFERGALFTGLLRYDIPLQPFEVDELKERWKAAYGGVENWTDIGVVDQGGEYQRITPTFEEMGFGALDERSESRVLGPFGVPPILIGTRLGLLRSTYSNYSLARQAFWEDTMVPENRLFEVELQYHLRGDEEERVAFDYTSVPALRSDIDKQSQAWARFVQYGMPKDTASHAVGVSHPPLPDGLTSYMPLNMRAVGEIEPDKAPADVSDKTWNSYP